MNENEIEVAFFSVVSIYCHTHLRNLKLFANPLDRRKKIFITYKSKHDEKINGSENVN